MKKTLFFLSIVALLGGYVGNKYNLFRRVAISAAFHDLEHSLNTQRKPTVTCWGDSLTAGWGAPLLHDFPTLLSILFDVPTVNEGVPKETSHQIKDRFLKRKRGTSPERVIIWAGRNSFGPDVAPPDIAEMVASLNPGSDFLILGILNADAPSERKGASNYDAILKTNSILRETYGSRFVPLREILVSNGSNPGDAEDITNDVIPRSLRFDHLHLNSFGQVITATAVYKAMIANRW